MSRNVTRVNDNNSQQHIKTNHGTLNYNPSFNPIIDNGEESDENEIDEDILESNVQ